jgi:hypothetical protein
MLNIAVASSFQIFNIFKSELNSDSLCIVSVYPGFKTRWNYLEIRRCVRDSDNGKSAEEGLISRSQLSETRATWT